MTPKTIGMALSIGTVVAGGVIIYKNKDKEGFWKGFGSAFLIFSLSGAILMAASKSATTRI